MKFCSFENFREKYCKNDSDPDQRTGDGSRRKRMRHIVKLDEETYCFLIFSAMTAT